MTLKKWFQELKSNKHSTRLSLGIGVIIGAGAICLIEKSVNLACLKMHLTTDQGKSLYTLGQFYARRIETMRLTDSEARLVSQGFQDWAGKKIARVDFDSHQASLQSLMDNRQSDQLELAQKEGQIYLKKFVKSGGTLSFSGLAYRVIAPGSQKKPTLKDWVQVNYQGTLTNGKVVDTTEGSDGKATFPMNGVIKGWTEGLQLIGEGGEIELVIPPELAYGTSGAPADIPPGATLVFRIRLHKVLDSGRKNPTPAS